MILISLKCEMALSACFHAFLTLITHVFFSKTQKKRKNPADKPSENPIITQEYCRNIAGKTKISPLLTRLLLPDNVGLTWFFDFWGVQKKT